jgi:uncharacterized membrane protein
MDYLGMGHLATALLAIAVGAVVVFRRKGTRFHRWCGRVYVAAMLALNISALCIYDLFGFFGPFHYAALFSLLTVIVGVRAAWLRRGNWRPVHAYWMSWSYVGLLAAAVSESATRYLDFGFGWTVAIATGLVLLGGGWVINRRLPGLVGAR